MNNHKIIIPSISIEEAPVDNKTYARKYSTWVETLTKTEIESGLQDAVDTIADMLGVL